MKRLLMSGLALAMLTGGALAQPAPLPGAPATPDATGVQTPPQSQPGGPDGMHAGAQRLPLPPTGTPVSGMSTDMKAPPPPGGPAAMMDDVGGPPPHPPGGPRGGPGGPEGRRPPPPPPSRAAHFRLGHGDVALDVKCADDEPMKACGDLTLQLLDKLQAMPNVSNPDAAAPKP